MSLAFLSKKSWHTANLSNQEKVWMAEQRKATEETKLKELSKQITLEREREEFERISGRVSSKIDRGIDWMYEGGGAAAEEEDKKREADEYLLGKAFVPAAKTEAKGAGGFNSVVASSTVAPKNEITIESDQKSEQKDWNEEFRLRYEDPMHLVQQQHEKKQSLQNKQALFEKVSRHRQEKNISSSGRHNFKKRKESKHRKRRKSFDDEEDSRRRPKHHRHRRRARSSESSSSPPKKISIKNPKYGLQSSSNPVSSYQPSCLGPDPHLIASKKAASEKSRLQNHALKHRRRVTNSDKKAKALEEMKNLAMERQHQMHSKSTAAVQLPLESENNPTKGASFLHELAGRAHDISMSDRVHRKRHTHQRLYETNTKFL